MTLTDQMKSFMKAHTEISLDYGVKGNVVGTITYLTPQYVHVQVRKGEYGIPILLVKSVTACD